VNADKIVEALLGDEDPKEFLSQNVDLGFDAAFVSKGWAKRGELEYGKVSQDGDTRWIVNIDEINNNWFAVFSGEQLYEDDKRGRWWEDFDIDGEIALKPDQTVEDFVAEIEDFLCDKTGPEFDPQEADLQDELSRADDWYDRDR
jgi:hypothetical protein